MGQRGPLHESGDSNFVLSHQSLMKRHNKEKTLSRRPAHARTKPPVAVVVDGAAEEVEEKTPHGKNKTPFSEQSAGPSFFQLESESLTNSIRTSDTV